MQLHQTRLNRLILEVKRNGFENIGAKLIPCLGLSEDGVTKRACEISTFFRIANVKDQLHAIRIAKPDRIAIAKTVAHPIPDVVRMPEPHDRGYNILGASGRHRVRGKDCVHLTTLLYHSSSMNSFLPEPADTGRYG